MPFNVQIELASSSEQNARDRLLQFPTRDILTIPLTPGKLIPIGGAARNEDLKYIADEVLGGTGLVIITAPTGDPDVEFSRYANIFDRLGVRGDIFHLRAELTRENGQEMLEQSSTAFITGGNQMLGRRALENQGMDLALMDFYGEGGVVAGSSAGASLISELMPYNDDIVEGLGLLQGVIIDQHYDTRRQREERLRRAVDVTARVGLGIGEGTGIRYSMGRIDVFGKGSVHVLWGDVNGSVDRYLRAGEGMELSAPQNIVSFPG